MMTYLMMTLGKQQKRLEGMAMRSHAEGVTGVMLVCRDVMG